MVEMEIEELLSTVSLCGVWMESFRSSSQEKLLLLLSKKPSLRYIAYCLINNESLSVGKMLKELQICVPCYRIIAIGNENWYSSQSIDTQNALLQTQDQADIFVRCTFPVADAQKTLLLFCDYILSFSPKRQEMRLSKIGDFIKNNRPFHKH